MLGGFIIWGIDMEELTAKLDACFSRLQDLQIKPTLGNMEILVQTLYDLREVYNELKERDNDVRSDSERRAKADL